MIDDEHYELVNLQVMNNLRASPASLPAQILTSFGWCPLLLHCLRMSLKAYTKAAGSPFSEATSWLMIPHLALARRTTHWPLCSFFGPHRHHSLPFWHQPEKASGRRPTSYWRKQTGRSQTPIPWISTSSRWRVFDLLSSGPSLPATRKRTP